MLNNVWHCVWTHHVDWCCVDTPSWTTLCGHRGVCIIVLINKIYYIKHDIIVHKAATHLTGFLVPKHGRDWIAGHFTSEGDTSAHTDDFVTRGYNEWRLSCKQNMRKWERRLDVTRSQACTVDRHNIVISETWNEKPRRGRMLHHAKHAQLTGITLLFPQLSYHKLSLNRI